MKVLVLTEDYPNNDGKIALMYVHTRNVYYQKNGLIVDNLSFSAKSSYDIDGIHVLSLRDYERSDEKYEVLILHAANVRHHYQFLKKYGNRFRRYIFFYHGHEVLKIHSVYSKPYEYIKVNKAKVMLQNIYDDFKLFLWRRYLPSVINKSHLVFVSQWMLNEFEKWTRIPRKEIEGHYTITYNCVGKEFQDNSYDAKQSKEFDFVTIRGNLDGSKYSIDIVNELANKTPEGKFLIVGKGEFFSHYKKAENITWVNANLSHNEIITILNRSRYALMPTRTDAQGLMMCEMAAFGIPVITSDIAVCHEVFDGFNNAYFISNTEIVSLREFLNKESQCEKDIRYYCENTVNKEFLLIQSL